MLTAMPPAASRAPGEYLLALLFAASPIVGSIWVTPSETRWVVFGVGVFMVVSVLLAAAKPIKSAK
jgi:hypothetical protein